MTPVPPVGKYWSERVPRFPIDLSSMRQGATQEFDNASRNVKKTWQRLAYLIRPEYLSLVQDNGIGRPPLQLVGPEPGIMASSGSIEFAAMASQFLPHFYGAGTVLEIGGGYGGLAHAVLTAAAREYTIIDLPEVGQFAQFYLQGWGQRARVVTPQGWIPQSYDLYIQTRGFMEMSPEEVAWYFDIIQSTARPGSLFFTINRRIKRTKFAEYPFDRKWTVISSGLWPESKGMPMLLLQRTETESDEVADVIKALCGVGL